MNLKLTIQRTLTLFSEFADLLEQHIRFEERSWFPHLEEKPEKHCTIFIPKKRVRMMMNSGNNLL